MTRLDLGDLIGLGLGCLGAFVVVVAVGAIFIYTRIRSQEKTEGPPPQPPPMTVDAHALGLDISAPDRTARKRAPRPAQPLTPTPATSKLTPSVDAVILPPTWSQTPIEVDEEMKTEKMVSPSPPAGVGVDIEDETEVRTVMTPSLLPPIGLPDVDDVDSATIIIDRSAGFDGLKTTHDTEDT